MHLHLLSTLWCSSTPSALYNMVDWSPTDQLYPGIQLHAFLLIYKEKRKKKKRTKRGEKMHKASLSFRSKQKDVIRFTKSHEHIKSHWGFWVWHLFFLHCREGKGTGKFVEEQSCPLVESRVAHGQETKRLFHLLSTILAKDWAASTCWVSAWWSSWPQGWGWSGGSGHPTDQR